MDKKIRLFALGGLDEEGKNCIVVEIDDSLFVVECGIMNPDKTMPGVDYVIPRFDYLLDHKSQIKAYFLLHGHDDEVGALAYIYEQCPAPIYGSKATLALLNGFTRHVGKDPSMYKTHEVLPSSTFMVDGREINYFHTAHNVADSSGISISTSYGNIVITGDYVVENTASKTFLHDMNAIAKIAERPTLALLPESVYANRPGYTAPLYRLTPHISEAFKNAPGRIFVALASNSFFNFDELVKQCVAFRKKIIFYDEPSAAVYEAVKSSGTEIPSVNLTSIDEILRLKDQDIVVLMAGFGSKLFRRMALLASKQNEDKRVVIKPTDTFIIGTTANDNTEIEYTDALDTLYRTGCNVIAVNKKSFLRMHASEEDLKMMASILKPKYYIPVKGFYKDLLHNAMLALSMGIGLNHNNVFVIENGMPVVFDNGVASVGTGDIAHGDLMIDGSGIGDVSDEVIAEREKLEGGVVIITTVISQAERRIVAGPEVQMRGFIYSKEAEPIVREATRITKTAIEEFFEKRPPYNVLEMRQVVGEKVLRSIKRLTGKDPMILPIIESI